jgi:hypothetical protein
MKQSNSMVNFQPEWISAYKYAAADAAVMDIMSQMSVVAFGQPMRNLESIRRLQKKGVRCLPYISFYKAPRLSLIDDEQPDWEGGSPARKEVLLNPFWKILDLDIHPEWVNVDPKGNPRHPFLAPDYQKGWRMLCHWNSDYYTTALEGVRALMEQGFDGVYIDNFAGSGMCICYGDCAGKHPHDKSGHAAEYDLILVHLMEKRKFHERVTELVKSYGRDKIVMVNSGEVAGETGYPDLWDLAIVRESFIHSFAWEGRKDPELTTNRLETIVNQLAATQCIPLVIDYVLRGQAPKVKDVGKNLSPQEIKDETFFGYACARTAGAVWADWMSLDAATARVFHSIRMGIRPLDVRKEAGGVCYREYPGGVVAVNFSQDNRNAALPLSHHRGKLIDLYADSEVTVENSSLKVLVPANSGRVFLALAG